MKKKYLNHISFQNFFHTPDSIYSLKIEENTFINPINSKSKFSKNKNSKLNLNTIYKNNISKSIFTNENINNKIYSTKSYNKSQSNLNESYFNKDKNNSTNIFYKKKKSSSIKIINKINLFHNEIIDNFLNKKKNLKCKNNSLNKESIDLSFSNKINLNNSIDNINIRAIEKINKISFGKSFHKKNNSQEINNKEIYLDKKYIIILEEKIKNLKINVYNLQKIKNKLYKEIYLNIPKKEEEEIIYMLTKEIIKYEKITKNYKNNLDKLSKEIINLRLEINKYINNYK